MHVERCANVTTATTYFFRILDEFLSSVTSWSLSLTSELAKDHERTVGASPFAVLERWNVESMASIVMESK